MKIGIDIGGSHIAIGLVNEKGEIKLKIEKELKLIEINDNNKAQVEIINLIVEAVKEITLKDNILLSEIELVGISFPGDVNKNCITKAENLGIFNFNIVKMLENILNTQVILRNDAKCAALAEKEYGSLKHCNDAIFIILGTGVGGAAFIDGKLLIPKRHPGFEFGHTIIEKDGIQCNCGAKGCFEKYASMQYLKSKIKEKAKINLEGKELKDYIKNNIENEKIQEVMDNYIEYLTIGIANFINIFEPEIVCIGGSFTYYEDILLDRLINTINRSNVIYNPEDIPKIVVAKLKNDAGIIGATII